MITCAIIAGAIVLTIPDGGVLIIPTTQCTRITADGAGTRVDFGDSKSIGLDVPLADVIAAIQSCKP